MAQWNELETLKQRGMRVIEVIPTADAGTEIVAEVPQEIIEEQRRKQREGLKLENAAAMLLRAAIANRGEVQRKEFRSGELGLDVYLGIDNVLRVQLWQLDMTPDLLWPDVLRAMGMKADGEIKRFSKMRQRYVQAAVVKADEVSE
jgi:hypothetical protein